MYKKYNPCPPQPKLRFEAPYTPHQSSPGPGAIPESVRVTSEQCNPVWLTTAVVPICQSTFTSPVVTPAGVQFPPTGRVQKIQVPFIPGTPPAYAVIQSVPASLTTRQNAIATVAQGANPYNPATRFSQYFPPAPVPLPCPIRPQVVQPPPQPDNCDPITRFKGSSLDEP